MRYAEEIYTAVSLAVVVAIVAGIHWMIGGEITVVKVMYWTGSGMVGYLLARWVRYRRGHPPQAGE